jgi:outer membrane protein OmpA-like peptidoglycan-associated protein
MRVLPIHFTILALATPAFADEQPAQGPHQQPAQGAPPQAGAPKKKCPAKPAASTETLIDKRLESELVSLGDVYFDFDKSKVKEEFSDDLAQVADFAKNHPDAMIVLDGRTDPVGTQAYNAGLSVRRARAVKCKLTTLGVDSDRIFLVGFGEDTARGQTHAQDRRVDIVATEAPLYAIVKQQMGVKAISVQWDEPVPQTAMEAPKSGKIIVIREGEPLPTGQQGPGEG